MREKYRFLGIFLQKPNHKNPIFGTKYGYFLHRILSMEMYFWSQSPKKILHSVSLIENSSLDIYQTPIKDFSLDLYIKSC